MKAKIIYQFEKFCLNATERLLMRDGKPMQLTPKTFEMLLAFVESKGSLITKQELMERIWPGTHVDDHNLTVTLAMLRKILSHGQARTNYIETVAKEGYRFLVPVEIKRRELDERWLPRSETINSVLPKQSDQKSEPQTLTENTEVRPDGKEDIPATRSLRLKYAVGVAVVAVAVVAAAIYTMPFSSAVSLSPLLFRVGFTANTVQGFDGQGRLIWTHSFSGTIDPDYLSHAERLTGLVRFVDLGSGRGRAVLVTLPLLVGPNPGDGFRAEVDCFSSEGRRLWSYVPQEKFRFGSYELEGPWIIWDVFVSPDPHPAVWVALGHYRWGNSFVVQLDPATGGHTLRLVNTGIIYKLNELHIAGRSYLLAGGFNNEYAAGSLAVMDERRPFAVSPQTEGTRHSCQSCPQGSLDYYFVFPRSEINRLRNFWEDSVHFININGGEIEVGKAELASPELGREEQLKSVEVFYDFHTQPEIRPFSFRFDSGYDLLHRELEEENKLRHSLASCPERLHPEPVRMWTPFSGWTQISLNPVRPVD